MTLMTLMTLVRRERQVKARNLGREDLNQLSTFGSSASRSDWFSGIISI